MKNKNVIAVSLVVLSIVLAVVSYIILPESVIMQFSATEGGVNRMPKLAAISIPLLLGVAGGILSILSKDEKGKSKTLLISVVGNILFFIVIIINKLI